MVRGQPFTRSRRSARSWCRSTRPSSRPSSSSASAARTCARIDQRRARGRRVRADRGRLGAPGRGDHDERRARPGAHARAAGRGRLRASGSRRAIRTSRSSTSSPPARPAGPKRVPRTHGQIAAEADLYATLGDRPGGPRSSARSRCSTRGAWARACSRRRTWGATVVILEDPNPFLLKRHRALELIERERCTVFPGVPFHFRLMAEAPGGADLSSLRLCFSAGTALARETFDAFGEKFGVLVRQLYGSHRDRDHGREHERGPGRDVRVGRARRWVASTFEIVDEDGELLPAGEVGEVTVVSPAMTSGYADMPERQRGRRSATGASSPATSARLDEDGALTIVGRKKLLIEVGGYKVDPIEVRGRGRRAPAGRPRRSSSASTARSPARSSSRRSWCRASELRRARADRVLPRAAGQLQGPPGGRVPRRDPEEPARARCCASTCV